MHMHAHIMDLAISLVTITYICNLPYANIIQLNILVPCLYVHVFHISQSYEAGHQFCGLSFFCICTLNSLEM